MRRLIIACAAALAVGAAGTAHADGWDHHGWGHRGWDHDDGDRDGWRGGWGPQIFVQAPLPVPPPVYYAPPPRYYPPPPAYYPPPPAFYAPPSVSFGLSLPVR